MKKSPMKRYSILLVVFIFLLLTGCERADEARTDQSDPRRVIGGNLVHGG